MFENIWPDDYFDISIEEREVERQEFFTPLGRQLPNIVHLPQGGSFLTRNICGDFGSVHDDVGGLLAHFPGEWALGQFDPEQIAFPDDSFLVCCIVAIGDSDLDHRNGNGFAEHVKHRGLPRFPQFGLPLDRGDNSVDGFEQVSAPAEMIECAHTYQAFQGAAVERSGIDASANIFYIFERSGGLASLNDRIDRRCSDVLDCGEPEPDRVVAVGVSLDRETGPRVVDTGRFHGDSYPRRFPDGITDFFRVARRRIQHSREEFGGVIRFEVGGPVGDVCV